MRVVVGSQNPVKIDAVRAVIGRVWPQARVLGSPAPSGVSAMPLSDEECICGARQRATTARGMVDADLGLGLEGGVHPVDGSLFLVGWVVAVDRAGHESSASAVRMPLPPAIAEAVLSGQELGPLMDRLTGRSSTNQAEGAIGILTHMLMTRQRSFEAGVAYALVPWLNHTWYGLDRPDGWQLSQPAPPVRGRRGMTLEVFRLLDEIDRAAETMAQEQHEYGQLAAKAVGRLRQFSGQLDLLRRKAELAHNKLGGLWRGAVPEGEPIDAAFDPPAGCEVVRHVIATDGSQIFPDRHGIAHFALVNIGAVHLQPGSGDPPAGLTFPELLYGDRLRDDEKAEGLQAADISRQRDIQELSRLVDLSCSQAGATVALMDSALLLYILQPDPEQTLLDWFVSELSRAFQAGVYLAGYVDRPGSRGVADLLALAPVPEAQISADNPALRLYKEMPDRTVFRRLLRPGQRSALFSSVSPFNRRLADRGDHFRVAFFYINVGSPEEPVIARVETPYWVAHVPTRLSQLHAAIWDQCQAPGRYPYVLARAHETAVVNVEQRRQLEDMLAGAMLARGLEPQTSAKSFLKSLTAG